MFWIDRIISKPLLKLISGENALKAILITWLLIHLTFVGLTSWMLYRRLVKKQKTIANLVIPIISSVIHLLIPYNSGDEFIDMILGAFSNMGGFTMFLAGFGLLLAIGSIILYFVYKEENKEEEEEDTNRVEEEVSFTSKQPKEKISQEPSTPYQKKFEEVYQNPFQRDSREKRILLRELGRKQRRKNSYLIQFIINLAVAQWLLPLLTYLFYWIHLKEKMKVQALNHPGAGLATEIPFGTVIKDFFKILTSESYFYGGHNIIISITWKIGIIAAFLLPLAFWIYNLVRFLSINGEVKQLEAEIKELE